MSAEYDAVEGRLSAAGLIDGSPIDLDEIRGLACDAGKAQRAPTKAQKLALYRRDRGCIGCGIRPQACDAHHIVPWEHNGPTHIDNLVLLCPRCHRKVALRDEAGTGVF